MERSKQINELWGPQMLNALTAKDAAVVFMVGTTKDGKLVNAVTADITPQALKEHLKKVIDKL